MKRHNASKIWCKLVVSDTRKNKKMTINLRRTDIEALNLKYVDMENIEYKRECVIGEKFIRIYLRKEVDTSYKKPIVTPYPITMEEMNKRKEELIGDIVKDDKRQEEISKIEEKPSILTRLRNWADRFK